MEETRFQRWRRLNPDRVKEIERRHKAKKAMQPCSVDGCERPCAYRAWCLSHYKRWIRYGDPLAGSYPRGTLEKRFWAKVDKSGDCWLWTGSLSNKGYGEMWAGADVGKNLDAHKVSWLLHFGDVPAGLEVCHTCNIGRCVRPEHLYVDTHQGNMQYMVASGRNQAVTHPESVPRGDQHWTRSGRITPR